MVQAQSVCVLSVCKGTVVCGVQAIYKQCHSCTCTLCENSVRDKTLQVVQAQFCVCVCVCLCACLWVCACLCVYVCVLCLCVQVYSRWVCAR